MRLSLGGFSTVVMTDRWFQELRAGRAFETSRGLGAVAGQYSMVQIKNPAASGRQVIVAQIKVWLDAAVGLYIARYDTDLTTDGGVLTNLLIGEAAGVCHQRYETNAAMPGAVFDYQLLAANVGTVLYPSWGPELSPGRGLLVTADAVNHVINAEFLINEV